MSEVTDYRVVSAIYTRADAHDFHDRLSKKVAEYLVGGWQPHGDMQASTLDGVLVVMQPMVRYRSEWRGTEQILARIP